MLKKVEVILRPYQVQNLIQKLSGMGIYFYLEDCKGFGKRFSPLMLYKKKNDGSLETLPKTKITLFVNEEQKENVFEAVLEKNDTGISGSGKIFTIPVITVIDIESRQIND